MRPTEVIPKFCLLLNDGKRVPVMGNGTQSRRYLYAGDATNALDTILHKGEVGQIYNIDSGDELTTLDLTLQLLKSLNVIGDREALIGTWVDFSPDRPYHDQSYLTDGSKLRKLGWKQTTSFKDGITITMDWYRRFGEEWWTRCY
jgi:dTDP-D-glucose 4,6-dehydratase